MVLYHANGRVVKAHEDYLEKEAQEHSRLCQYDDQAEFARARDTNARNKKDMRVYIVVGEQFEYRELYGRFIQGKIMDGFKIKQSGRLPPRGLDRRTLMRCSSLADGYFTSNPGEIELKIPIIYPRHHIAGKYHPIYDDQMAHVREGEITAYIIPWLRKMERLLKTKEECLKKRKGDPKKPVTIPLSELPAVGIPESLLEKIHLYNVMLQFGISSHFQRPLVDALILQMYQTNLSNCHLDTLEMTVCRFYSRGMAILDPVINHLIGTYFLRTATDRANPIPPDNLRRLNLVENNAVTEETRYLPREAAREWLEYKNVQPDLRKYYPEDTVSLPPRLEVLGHCIRHWSGVRRNGGTAAAHTGFPLNVGRVFKYYRRKPTDVVRPKHGDGNTRRNIDYADYSTYRLKKTEYFHNNPPGAAPSFPSVPDSNSDGEPR
jgi:hypothetical protein